MGDDGLSVEPIKVYENTYLMQPMDNARFRRSECEAIMKKVLDDKMAVVNERDKKGRLSWVYDPEDAGDIIREIVQDCQVRGQPTSSPRPSPLVPRQSAQQFV